MVIQELLKWGTDALEKIEYSDPRQETRLILAQLLGVDRSYLYAHGDLEVPDYIKDKFNMIIDRRRAGEPLQYILGTQEFMGIELKVDKGVLIPRGDTELLVEWILSYIDEKLDGRPCRMLDIGIGSGAIALAVAYHRPDGQIIGVDISREALKIAEENRKRIQLDNVSFMESDLFSSIGKEYLGSFDIIVSNPPYIPERDIESLQIEVRLHEPRLALSGGEDGLDYYRKITAEAGKYLAKGGILIYEIGAGQGADVADIMKRNGFKEITVIKDLEDRDRIVAGRQ